MIEVAEEVLAQADALMYEDDSNERAATLLKEAHDFSEKRRMAGALGGQKRAMNAGQTIRKPPQPIIRNEYPSKNELYDFAQEQEIPDGIARQFFEINESRNWKHKNGLKITNWRGALVNFAKKNGE